MTLRLADRIRHMPIVREAFGAGDLAESALRLLADAWSEQVAEVFARDEEMLCGWAMTLSHKDFRFVLDTWRLHADPDQADNTVEERYDSRSVHMSAMLDGMGRIDGTLDPEGFALVREAIRAVSQPCDDDTRTAAQRRADGMVTMARIVLENIEPVPGRKRRKPKVVATIDYDDLVAATGGGLRGDRPRPHRGPRRHDPAHGVRRIDAPPGHRAAVDDRRLRTRPAGRVGLVVRRARPPRSRLPDRRLHDTGVGV